MLSVYGRNTMISTASRVVFGEDALRVRCFFLFERCLADVDTVDSWGFVLPDMLRGIPYSVLMTIEQKACSIQ
jgi:hypothetical protein